MGGRTWDRSSSFPKTKAWGQGCSGGSRGGARPPLFLDQNEARRDEKCFCEDAPPSMSGPGWSLPPAPTPLSEGLDPPLGCHHSLSLVQSNLVGTYAMDLSSSFGKVALIIQLYCPFYSQQNCSCHIRQEQYM